MNQKDLQNQLKDLERMISHLKEVLNQKKGADQEKEDLKAQLNALEEQIKYCEEIILKEGVSKEKIKAYAMEKRLLEASKKEYMSSIRNAAEVACVEINPKANTKITVLVGKTAQAKILEEKLRDTERNVGIIIIDEEKRGNLFQKAEKEYEERAGGHLPGVGAPGIPGGVDFLLSEGIRILMIWIAMHLAKEVDEHLWVVVKNIIKEITGLDKSYKKKSLVAITTNDNPEIIFIFPKKVEDKELEDIVKYINSETQKITSQKKVSLGYKYEYNRKTKSWKLVER